MGKKKKKIKELEERIEALEEFKEFLLQEKISELRSQLRTAGFDMNLNDQLMAGVGPMSIADARKTNGKIFSTYC